MQICKDLSLKLPLITVFDFLSDIARILFACWWLFIQVITSFYTAELTAVLTLTASELPVTNLSDLEVPDSTARWVAVNGSEINILLKVSQCFL